MKEQLDDDVRKVALFLQKMKRSPDWPRVRQIILHVKPSEGVIAKIQIECPKFFNLKDGHW